MGEGRFWARICFEGRVHVSEDSISWRNLARLPAVMLNVITAFAFRDIHLLVSLCIYFLYI